VLENLHLQFSSAQEEYSAMRDQYMRTGEGFILVYSITSRGSFDEIAGFRDQILRVKDRDRMPMVLVANKSDLESERQVATSEGNDLAKSFGCQFFETSAKARVNVDECFFGLVRAIRIERNGGVKEKKSKKGKRKLLKDCKIL